MNSKQHAYQPVFETTRGGIVESVHFGAIVVVNALGETLAWHGNPETITFLRSTAKPLQALPFLQKGGHKTFGLTTREIALLCASHSGTDEHVKVARKIQKKIGISEEALLCGTHAPYHKPTARLLADRGKQPTPNRHNCSGKHTGMLALAKLEGASLKTYTEIEHPVQQNILQTLGKISSLEVDKIGLGVDGCSVPNFAMPMRNAALALARLVDPQGLAPKLAEACQTVTEAMIAYPNMVAGPGRFDTRLMEVAQGKVVTKAGAEAYQGVGIPAGALGPNAQALGIAIKIADGDGRKRAKTAVVIEVLKQLNVLTAQELTALQEFGPTKTIRNHRGLIVGKGQPCFTLKEPEN